MTLAIVDKAAAEVFPRAVRQRAQAAASAPKARAPSGRRTQLALAGLALLGVAGIGVAIWLSQQGPTAVAGGPVAVAVASDCDRGWP